MNRLQLLHPRQKESLGKKVNALEIHSSDYFILFSPLSYNTHLTRDNDHQLGKQSSVNRGKVQGREKRKEKKKDSRQEVTLT